MPYLGFHYEADIGGKTIGFAVMPRCTISGSSPLDTLTETASHEYFEWATDPFPFSDPAWSGVDDDHIMWEKLFLGELGDSAFSKAFAPQPKAWASCS